MLLFSELAEYSLFSNVIVNGSQWAHSSPTIADKRSFPNKACGGWLVISRVTGHELMSKSIEKLTNDQSPNAKSCLHWGE